MEGGGRTLSAKATNDLFIEEGICWSVDTTTYAGFSKRIEAVGADECATAQRLHFDDSVVLA
jgi:hypothetical protein